MSKDILIVDDENDIRTLIRGILEDEGYHIREAANATQALDEVEKKAPDLMILDIWLHDSDKDGLEILKTVKAENDILPVIMISGHGTIETAVSAIKKGAYDFIEKPFQSDRLLLMISRALENAALKQENAALKARSEQMEDELIGDSAAIKQIKSQIERIAPTNSRVLITGEGGTGKEVVARALHRGSERKASPFRALNCAVLHPERLEEELFGSRKDGEPPKQGVLELASGGTLFLDEVADMPLETQGKILRVLQESKIYPLGSTQEAIDIDVRVMASTNQDLAKCIEVGDFREDLYYRLNVVTLHIPPLAKRRDDIVPLAEYFLHNYAVQMGQQPREISAEVLKILTSYKWPGNVRQLKNVMEWITIMQPEEQPQSEEDQKQIMLKDLPPELTGGGVKTSETQGDNLNLDYTSQSLRDAREMFEKEYLTLQIARFDGNVSKAAKFIGMERSALHRKLKSLDISVGSKQDSNEGVAGSPPRKSA